MKNLIQCNQLEIGYSSKTDGSKRLFPVFDLQLNAGELTALVGPNGAGKTTLLRSISGNLKPISGKIFLMQKELQYYQAGELAKIISIVTTDKIVDNHISVFDVVATGRYPYTGFWATLSVLDKEIIFSCLELVGMTDFSERLFHRLSDGERQKVMIAKALSQDTPIIFMDEPAAFLDYPSKIELMHLLQKLVRQHQKTILYSSHDLDHVLQTADRLWLIAQGKPIQTGIPEQLVLDGLIESYFTRAGLHFDAEKGKFSHTFSGKKKIFIKAEGINGIWLRNALDRKGFVESDDSQCELKIEIIDQKFHLTIKTKIYVCIKIEEILIQLSEYEKAD